ncbi:probable receptor-like protein kinase At1g80640 [Gossypium raimondii]|uniref:probable receptor-like protein kinase At1g80640 n=1 Tax=Gossypium raimondii TaxID=29730 RepID=UPI00063AEC0F|nr:probable receptor-like protein kinase At1g80640 [Gossypium raimondii]
MDPIRKKLLIAAFTILCFSFTAILLSLVCLWKIHRKKKKNNSEKLLTQADDHSLEDAEKGVALSPSSFFAKCNSLCTLSLKGFASFIDYKMIEKATKNFDKINILDESGFKLVYKAILDNGTEVAVKKVFCLTKGIQREFENEVKLLSRFHHSNVISSYGYSIENETGFVVYELMHNGSLETQLHGPSRGSQLSWHRRLKIALDIARGLQYLNELCIPPIIHRNLKPSTILLDSNFNAKISDFGMAAVVAGGGGGKEGGLSRSLNFLGKTGPIAPESILNGILTDMNDVYAFGVILLELVLGRKALEMSEVSGQECLVRWARAVLTDRHVMPNVVDPVIRGTMSVKHLNQVGVIAYLCLEDEPKYRPLITDILNSLVPLVPVGLGGTLIV